MSEKQTEAAKAMECAEAIMKGNGKRAWALKMTEYIGEWNTLMLYLEKRVRAEKGA